MNFSENITHRVRLWIDNDQGLHEMVLHWAEDCLEHPTARRIDTVGRRTAALYDLSDQLEQHFTDLWTEPKAMPSPSDEFLRVALAYVDWDDIAEGYISQVEEERT